MVHDVRTTLFVLLCSFAVCVCITASLGRPFNSSVGGGDITSFPLTGEGDTIQPCNFTVPLHSSFEAIASLNFTLSSSSTLHFQKVGTYRWHQDNQIIKYIVLWKDLVLVTPALANDTVKW